MCFVFGWMQAICCVSLFSSVTYGHFGYSSTHTCHIINTFNCHNVIPNTFSAYVIMRTIYTIAKYFVRIRIGWALACAIDFWSFTHHATKWTYLCTIALCEPVYTDIHFVIVRKKCDPIYVSISLRYVLILDLDLCSIFWVLNLKFTIINIQNTAEQKKNANVLMCGGRKN